MRMQLMTITAAGLLLSGCGMMGIGGPSETVVVAPPVVAGSASGNTMDTEMNQSDQARPPRSYYYKKQ